MIHLAKYATVQDRARSTEVHSVFQGLMKAGYRQSALFHPLRSMRGKWARCLAAVAMQIALVASALWGGPPSVTAQSQAPDQRLILSETSLWALADAFFTEGEYYRAVTEYKRLLFYFPDGVHRADAQERIAQALLLGGEPRQALQYAHGRLAGAEGAQRDRWLVWDALGWMDLDGEKPMPLRGPNIANALTDLKAVSPESPAHDRIAGFVQAAETPTDVPHKSPALAGTLSAVVPGAGSLYVGRPSEAALSFFVNALLISGTVTAFHEHQDSLGVGLGVLALAFYGGSIYAAVSGAHKFNDQADAEYLDQQRMRFGLVLERGRIGAAFQHDF
jgi:hypothetical protein